ncbi:MAG: hypothetical protein LBB28_00625, partial [Synergistaceae bacterium]|nr:hypothetical protein [Synergistaceae bacterium]
TPEKHGLPAIRFAHEVLRVLRSADIEFPAIRSQTVDESVTIEGQSFYLRLSEILGSDKAASLALDEAGILGHRYLDGLSRDRGEGTRNYVIYDGKNTNVRETYYQQTRGQGEANIYAQTAYHGSPHSFDRFSLGFVGTGEGFQAFGWGLYFAGRRDTAESYRNALSGNEWTVEAYGETCAAENDSLNPFGGILRAYAERFGGDTEAIAGAIEGGDYIGFFPSPEMAARLSESVGDIRSGAIRMFKPDNGKLYAADIPDSDVLLDWDKPLSEQPEKVREAILSVVNRIRPFMEDYTAAYTPTDAEGAVYIAYEFSVLEEGDHNGGTRAERFGGKFYNILSNSLGSQKAASQYLNSLGIPGLQYLDRGSRGNGGDTRNYVIFDDRAIKTLETYYQFAGQRSNMTPPVGETLGRAISLKEEGIPNEDIYDETGWFTGMDGQWRYEIPDNLDKVNFPEGGEVFSLPEIYDNPALYMAYPELERLGVLLGTLGAPDGVFSLGRPGSEPLSGYSPRIEINELLPDDEKALALIHEIQHAIQRIEGFAAGGNPSLFSFVVDEASVEKAKEKFHAILGDKETEDSFFEIEDIRKKARERRERVDALNREIEKLDFDDEKTVRGSEELFNAETEAEELYRNALESLEYFENALRSKLSDEAYRELQRSYRKWAINPPEITPIAQYERLAGEIEAKDAASRAAGKRGVMPELRSDAIILYGGNVMSSIDMGHVMRDMPRGAIDLTNPNAITITLTPRSDATTTIHETGHLFRWLLERQAAAFPDDEQLQEDWKAVRDFGDHEKFADAAIEYAMTGDAPTPLRRAFRMFRQCLVRFYEAIRGNTGVKLNDEIKGVFDRILEADVRKTTQIITPDSSAPSERNIFFQPG